MTTRTWLAKSRHIASSAYHRTIGEVVQRRRSRAYVAREQAEGRAVAPLVPERADVAERDTPARTGFPQRTARSARTGRSPR